METVPRYPVTGTSAIVEVPTSRTPVAPASISDWLSGLSPVAWLSSWVRSIPVLLPRVDSGIASHGLPACSSRVSTDQFMESVLGVMSSTMPPGIAGHLHMRHPKTRQRNQAAVMR